MSAPFHIRDFDPAVARHLAGTGISAPLARVLAARGVERGSGLEYGLQDLARPDSMLGIDEAAAVLADAIDRARPVLVIADYDCDGATACAVAVRGLRAMGARVDYLVPNRFEFGYGLTPELVDHAARRNPSLIVTVDNGIASVEGVERASALGIEVLVTDHHLPGAQLPRARVIVNPNQAGCAFPSKNLAGVGVMFYVLVRLRALLRERGRFGAGTGPRLDDLLDLVALGTVADLVPLDRNNRILVHAGLERMRAGRMQAGIAALFAVAGRSARRAPAADLGFALAPRLNAAGRLEDMSLGIECLLADDPDAARAHAARLDTLNRERRSLEARMQEEAGEVLAAAAASEGPVQGRSTITVFAQDWHPGIVGLVASRLKERHHRPAIAFAADGEAALRGSGRSIAGVHLRDVLDRVSKEDPAMILRFGGHAMAAGLTIARGSLPAFAEAFERAARSLADPSAFSPRLDVDGSLEPREITATLIEAIERQVWGQGFPAPLFADEFEVQSQRLVKDEHMQLELRRGATAWRAIWFRRTQPLPRRAVLAYRPGIDEYRGERRVTLTVEAMAPV
jgi:single-stranded-DNA-specific exonuclease